MTATTDLAYLQLQPNLRTEEQMTFHFIGECGRFGLWPFRTYTQWTSLCLCEILRATGLLIYQARFTDKA